MKKLQPLELTLILLIALTFVISSCGKKQIETKTPVKDKWGGVTKDEYAKSKVSLDFAMDVLRELDKKGPDSTELSKKLAECIYDSQTDFLEKTYPAGPEKKDFDYRSHLKDEDYEEILNNCIKKLSLDKQ